MQINLLRYTGAYILAALGLAVIAWALEYFAGFDFPTGTAAVIPPMVAAMVEGQKAARILRAPIPNPAAWRSALSMTAVVAALNLLVLLPLSLLPEMRALLAQVGLPLFALIVAAVLGVILLVNRLFLTMGAKNELKVISARQACSK